VKAGKCKGSANIRLDFTLMSPIRFKAIFSVLSADEPILAADVISRPIFYCYYLIPGLNRLQRSVRRVESWIN
jgi:hypothetical protein